MSLEVGQLAPDFTAKIETGETIKLSDYKGKKSDPLLLSQRCYTGLHRTSL